MGILAIDATRSSSLGCQLVLTLALAASLASGCAWLPQPSRSSDPAPEALAAHERARSQRAEQALEALTDRYRALEREREELESRHARQERTLRDSARQHEAARQATQGEIAGLQLLLLEKAAQLDAMSQRLDAAIREVVRSMAKLRSLDSKAEAASNLAEVEIALELLERESDGATADSGTAQARQHLGLASEEFKKENYGGALYLAAQAKGLLRRGARVTVTSHDPPEVKGETPFVQPFPLRVLTTSNVRIGPGLDHKVAFIADKGTLVVASSFKQSWVRVQVDDGRSGWISYHLVGRP